MIKWLDLKNKLWGWSAGEVTCCHTCPPGAMRVDGRSDICTLSSDLSWDLLPAVKGGRVESAKPSVVLSYNSANLLPHMGNFRSGQAGPEGAQEVVKTDSNPEARIPPVLWCDLRHELSGAGPLSQPWVPPTRLPRGLSGLKGFLQDEARRTKAVCDQVQMNDWCVWVLIGSSLCSQGNPKHILLKQTL